MASGSHDMLYDIKRAARCMLPFLTYFLRSLSSFLPKIYARFFRYEWLLLIELV